MHGTDGSCDVLLNYLDEMHVIGMEEGKWGL
jgi:hypothetical protein